MPIAAVDVAAILLLVLPGFLAYRFAVSRRVEATERSTLWQITEILEYSLYVHLVGVSLVLGVHFGLARIGIPTYIPELFQRGPLDFLQSHFTQAAYIFTLYPIYIVVGATVIGVYDLPRTVGNLIVRTLTRFAQYRIWKISLPAPEPQFPQESIWYSAFRQLPERLQADRVLVNIKLKGGDVYYGALYSYPILPDNDNKKDILIIGAIYYPQGDFQEGLKLQDFDDTGAVLLNTANIESIEIIYGEPKPPVDSQTASE